MKIRGHIEVISPSLVKGWVCVNKDEQYYSPDKVCLLKNGKVVAKSTTFKERLDVASSFGANCSLKSGFEFNIRQQGVSFEDCDQYSVIAYYEEQEHYLDRDLSQNVNAVFENFVVSKVDGVLDNGNIHGWFAIYSNVESGIDLKIKIDKCKVKSTLLHTVRNDVSKIHSAKIQGGFQFVLDDSLYDNDYHTVEISLTVLGKEYQIHKSSMLLSLSCALRTEVQGSLSYRDGRELIGWAYDISNMNAQIPLHFVVDGHTVDTFETGSDFVRPFPGGDQLFRCGFRYWLDEKYDDGILHKVEIRAAFDNKYIGGTSFCFPKRMATQIPRSQKTKIENIFDNNLELQSKEVSHRKDIEVEMVSLVVVTHNGAHHLENLFESLIRHENHLIKYEVVIVDNASTDDTKDLVEKYSKYIDFNYLVMKCNLSYSKANNVGVDNAKYDVITLVNNDIVLVESVLRNMVGLLKGNSKVGLIGLKLLEKTASNSLRIHHAGISYSVEKWQPNLKVFSSWPVEINEEYINSRGDVSSDYPYSSPEVVDAVTAAFLMCRKSEFQAIGGFDESYYYGLEDVDLNIRLTQKFGKVAVCRNDLSAIHDCSATRRVKGRSDYFARLQESNKAVFSNRHLYDFRKTYTSKLYMDKPLQRNPAKVVFAVSEASWQTKAGDFYTAAELGEALGRKMNWDVRFCLTPQYKRLSTEEQSLIDADIVIAMNCNYQVEEIKDAKNTLIRVAWIRNRVDEWIEGGKLDLYDLILVSSTKIKTTLEDRISRSSIVFPIATNYTRFCQESTLNVRGTDIGFTGSAHAGRRGVIDKLVKYLPINSWKFSIYGHNWETDEEVSQYCRGAVPYLDLPEIYSDMKIVLDDCHPVALDWDSMNSRPFDALASGALVLTNNSAGVNELFGDFPVSYDTAEELEERVSYFLENDEIRIDMQEKMKSKVLQEHTYDHRADKLFESLSNLNKGLRLAIRIGVPNAEEKLSWGDYHFAIYLRRAFEEKGHVCTILMIPDWEWAKLSDVVIDIVGLSQPEPVIGCINILWLISHPTKTAPAVFSKYDHVFVASTQYAEKLKIIGVSNISPLLQFADPQVFKVPAVNDRIENEVLYVGNSRKEYRTGVKYCIEKGISFSLFGANWDEIVGSENVVSQHINSKKLHKYYGGSTVLINDHWDDMSSHGFVSNRIFEAGLCGCTVLTDHVDGIEELFPDAIYTYRDQNEFDEKLDELLINPDLRSRLSLNLRKIVLRDHTVEVRVERLLEKIYAISDSRRGVVGKSLESAKKGSRVNPLAITECKIQGISDEASAPTYLGASACPAPYHKKQDAA